MSATASIHTRRVDDKIAAALALVGILAAIPLGWYVGTAFSVIAAATCMAGALLFHRRITARRLHW